MTNYGYAHWQTYLHRKKKKMQFKSGAEAGFIPPDTPHWPRGDYFRDILPIFHCNFYSDGWRKIYFIRKPKKYTNRGLALFQGGKQWL